MAATGLVKVVIWNFFWLKNDGSDKDYTRCYELYVPADERFISWGVAHKYQPVTKHIFTKQAGRHTHIQRKEKDS